jgi:predicted nucleic acid-binding protein
MSFDPSRFSSASVVDTCAVWNMLSSQRLNGAAIRANLHFCITPVVLYECLSKHRPTASAEQSELMTRLRHERSIGRFPVQGCSLDDLLAVSAKAPGRLGAGELSCMATAYGIRSIAFMTDERLAFRHAEGALGLSVETTPRLYGYLHFKKHLVDSDHRLVIAEHEKFEKRPLTKFLQEAYEEAMRCTLMIAALPPSESGQSDGTEEGKA